MEQTLKSHSEIRAAALEYITPNSIRKIVRRPKVDVDPTITRVPFGDGTLSLRLWGSGEVVLLVHGWAANQTDFFEFVPALLARGFAAATVDLPAHGESSGDTAGLNLLGDGVLAAGNYIGHLKGVVAHSVGGAATQLALSQGLDAEKAVMLASPHDYELDVRRFAKRKQLNEDETAALIQNLEQMNVTVNVRSAEIVPKLKVPALIVHSKDDPLIPESTARELARYWPSSTLWLVDGMKHRGVLKDTDVIARVLEFLMQ